jgi:cyclic beta-1,2-glucan glucanotransferase
MYRLVLELVLGVSLEVDRLRFTPCLPPAWSGFSLRYRYRGTYYNIVMRCIEVESAAEPSVTVDGVAQAGNVLHMTDDGQEHHVEVHAAASCPAP